MTDTDPDAGPVALDLVDGVATVTLVRPERRNAIDAHLASALVSTLARVAADDSVRCLLIRGAGDHFSVGGDLAAGAGGLAQADEQRAVDELRAAMESVRLLRTVGAPTIAAVRGSCAGAGLSIACAADLRVASTSAVFSTAFVAAGVSGDYGGTWSLPRIVGHATARELFLLSERFDATRAHEIGLVSRVWSDDRFDEEVAAMVGRLASLPPLALRAVKANLDDAAGASFAEHLDTEARRHARTARSADAAEAASAFLEKRPAVFRGA